jgi:hypothetical protein
MCPSYFRIRVPLEEAIQRYAKWAKVPLPTDRQIIKSSRAHDAVIDERGHWRGKALFVSALEDWTLFRDISVGYCSVPGELWLQFAGSDDLVFANYNDACCFGSLVVIEGGKLVREFLDYADDPTENVNFGDLGPDFEPIESWVDVAGIVDDDKLGFSSTGFLWVY